MKNNHFFALISPFLVVLLYACNADDQPSPSAQSPLDVNVGSFNGTLPDGRVLDKTGIMTDSGLGGSGSSSDGSFVHHVLTMYDEESAIRISIELPTIKYSDELESPDDATLIQTARDYYPYDMVKDKLSLGDKPILSEVNNEMTHTFRVQVADQKDYVAYVSEGVDHSESYLKVVEVVEDTELTDTGDEVRTMLVTFDVDVQLQLANIDVTNGSSPLKGLLTLKYQQP